MVRRPVIILSEGGGQLGNQIIVFAHLIALSEEYGLRLWNADFQPYRQHFQGSKGGAVATYPPATKPARASALHRRITLLAKVLRRLLPEQTPLSNHITCEGHSPEFDIDLSSPDTLSRLRRAWVTCLFGWRYRNYTLLARHESAVRAYFRFQDTVETDAFMAAQRARADTVLGVHVRHGDYKDFEGGRYYLSIAEYAQAARALAAQLPGQRLSVVVFSNEPQDLSVFGDLDAIPGLGGMMPDFQALSMCDYLIGVPSTFSRMAAFLGRVPLRTISKGDLDVRLFDFRVPEH